ncbi:hypothetical protein HO173_012233 [Letharia columbiana]|uniref:Uncharacterized protein n=1 Tax=Letharia columbiana TaxID=112416 RepID=A0A8H6FGY6_9LECA|nr:uncharacterized protein HO173_012233 [Letharia columbiana]KAF6227493.1 hypothetical protein HO173_012233 [Letharia columbiana]
MLNLLGHEMLLWLPQDLLTEIRSDPEILIIVAHEISKMHKFAGLNPYFHIFITLQAFHIERLNEMLVVPSLGRVVLKIPPTVALRCPRSLSSWPHAPTRAVQDRSNTAKPSSGAAAVYPTVLSVESEHESEIPSATVLSKLNLFGLWRDEPETKGTDYQLSRHLTRRAQEGRRRQGLRVPPKENNGGTATQVPVGEGGLGVWLSQEYAEQEENGTEKEGRVVEEGGSRSDGQIADSYGGDRGDNGGGYYGGSGRGGGGDGNRHNEDQICT